MDKIVHNIRAIRTEKGFNQEEIANKVGLTRSSYNRLETGFTKITESKLNEIANALGVSVDEIKNYKSEEIDELSILKSEIETLKALIKSERENKELLLEKYKRLFEDQLNATHNTLEKISKKHKIPYIHIFEIYESELNKGFEQLLNNYIKGFEELKK